MVMSSITVKGIAPALGILGGFQRLVFNDIGSNSTLFQTDNMFVPTSMLPNYMNWETRNNTLSGFRWIHASTTLSTTGSLTLQSFEGASPTGTNLLTIDDALAINITAPINIGGALDMGGNRITSLATPISGTDAVNKAYVDPPYASIVWNSNATVSNIAAAGTYVKVAGTTTCPLSEIFTTIVTNRVTYPSGYAARDVTIDGALHFIPTGITGSGNVYFTFFKNGAAVTSMAPVGITVRNNGDRYLIPITGMIHIAATDYLELWVTADDDAIDVTVENGNYNVIRV